MLYMLPWGCGVAYYITAKNSSFQDCLDNTVELNNVPATKVNLRNLLWFTATFSNDLHPPVSSNYCHCCKMSVNISFIWQNPISKRTQKRASLPIETVSSMLVAVSGTVTRATAIFSKAPVAHETSIAVGTRHSWLAVAESCLGVTSPASAESCVGWTHWLAAASYGDMVKGDWDYEPWGHLWHLCKADKLLPSSLHSVVLSQNW